MAKVKFKNNLGGLAGRDGGPPATFHCMMLKEDGKTADGKYGHIMYGKSSPETPLPVRKGTTIWAEIEGLKVKPEIAYNNDHATVVTLDGDVKKPILKLS
jgi:hypothetical protein